MPDVLQDEQGGRDDWNEGHERARSQSVVVTTLYRLYQTLNLYEESFILSEMESH